MSTDVQRTRPTSDLTKSAREKHKQYLFPATIQYYQEPIVVTEAKGLRVSDADGNQYLDFFGGILTVSVGHANEKVNAAIKAQVDRLSHISTLYPTLPMVELAERLARITPGNLEQTYFTASGTEADETAVMMAELFTGRSEVIALRHGYSGRSTLAQSLTAQSSWRPLPTKVAGVKHWGDEPEIMTMAKGIANGLPLGVTICTPEIAASLKSLTISTFGGNPVSCAAGNATVQFIEEENLPANSETMGRRLRGGLEELKRRFPKNLGDVRGMGLMQAVELVVDETTRDRTPAKELTNRIFEEARKRGLLIGKGGLEGNEFPTAPPLPGDASEVDEALAILQESFEAAGAN